MRYQANERFALSKAELSDTFKNIVERLNLQITKELASAFSVHEIANFFCSTFHKQINAKLSPSRIDFVALYGHMHWVRMLKLKGAASSHAFDFQDESYQLGAGSVGKAAARRKIQFIWHLRQDAYHAEADHIYLGYGDDISLIAYPLIMQKPNKVVAVLLLGIRVDDEHLSRSFIEQVFIQALSAIGLELAELYSHIVKHIQGKLGRIYLEQTRKISEIAQKYYHSTNASVGSMAFMEALAVHFMDLLNRGNPKKSYYRNYLFYEYQEFRRKYILRFYKQQPRYLVNSFSLSHQLNTIYVRDREVKLAESQASFVHDRGKEPFVIRYTPNNIEEIREFLDANWSAARYGSAFVVPLFDGKKPLGVFVFLAPQQNRKYTKPLSFYTGKENRTSSMLQVKIFRALQRQIALHYMQLKLEQEQRVVEQLEKIMSALKEIILLENRSEILDRLAEFTVKSLDCEACIIYLLNLEKHKLEYAASCGFSGANQIKGALNSLLLDPKLCSRSLPYIVFKSKKEIIANSANDFRRIIKKHPYTTSVFQQIKSKNIISYFGQRIESIGVIELFNSSKATPAGWSYFDGLDKQTLLHICDAIATVLQRLEATKSQVENVKFKTTGDLLLDISHELKNPVYASLSFIRKLKSMLEVSDKSFDAHAFSEIVKLIERNTEKTQSILRGMQTFRSLVTSQNSEAVDLTKIITTVLNTNREIFEGNNIAVEKYYYLNGASVIGDPHQLNQVITNIITNAVHAMPKGGKISVRLYESKDKCTIEIADSGPGISDEVKDYIFDPFVTTKPSEQGVGIGLALCRRIVNQHNGKIEFDTEAGAGTTFKIHLPVHTTLQQEAVVHQ